MIYAWDWVEDYLENKIEDKKKLVATLGLHAFEDEMSNDDIVEFSLTPDRNHDALCHIGLAREIAAHSDNIFSTIDNHYAVIPEVDSVELSIDSDVPVSRFGAVVVENITAKETPDWMKKRLELLGQRSINLIVDITNYVMFDIGQPMHAYDIDKLGAPELNVRRAHAGEKIVTLDGTNYELETSHVVIANSKNIAVGLAGVKGGSTTGIDSTTSKVLFEAAHWDPTTTRKTAQSLRIHTDASKRFENEPAPEWTEFALKRALKLIKDIDPGIEVTAASDWHPTPRTLPQVVLKTADVERLLGPTLTKEELSTLLSKLEYTIEFEGDNIVVTPPFWRMDITILEDVLDDVARTYGLDAVPKLELPETDAEVQSYAGYGFMDRLRDILVNYRFFEIQTYSFTKKGDIEVAKPVARDKGALRKSLQEGMQEALKLNQHNSELFNRPFVALFEIGSVFPKAGEDVHLALAVGKEKKAQEARIFLEEVLQALNGLDYAFSARAKDITETEDGVLFEISLTKAFELDEVKSKPYTLNGTYTYERFSLFPFVLRDIAVWLPEGKSAGVVTHIVREEVENLLVAHRIFDQFENKEGRRSTAIRFVFQSDDQTLTDAIIGEKMNRIEKKLAQEGFEVR